MVWVRALHPALLLQALKQRKSRSSELRISRLQGGLPLLLLLYKPLKRSKPLDTR